MSATSQMLAAFKPVAAGGFDADAQDFFDRVVANGGTISGGTKTAVDNFVIAAKANGYWTKINRINLFCGDQLAAALVPLKVGGGNATDTNNNFVGGDYSEATGPTGNGTTKYAANGLVPSTSLTIQDTHLATYNRGSSAVGGGVMVGSGNVFNIYAPFSDGTFYSDQYSPAGGRVSAAVTGPYGFLIGSRTASNSHVIYKNGSSIASSAISGGALPGVECFIFADNVAGTPQFITSHNLAACSIGSGLTGGEATSYNTDMEAFQDALGRGVQ